MRNYTLLLVTALILGTSSVWMCATYAENPVQSAVTNHAFTGENPSPEHWGFERVLEINHSSEISGEIAYSIAFNYYGDLWGLIANPHPAGFGSRIGWSDNTAGQMAGYTDPWLFRGGPGWGSTHQAFSPTSIQEAHDGKWGPDPGPRVYLSDINYGEGETLLGGAALSSSGQRSILTFSPDGSLLAGTSSHTISVWNTTDTNDPFYLQEHDFSIDTGGHPRGGMVYGVSFSPNGTLLASCGGDGILIWDISNQSNAMTPIRDLREYLQDGDLSGYSFSMGAGPCTFSPNGKFIAASSLFNNTISIWDTTNWTMVQLLNGHERPSIDHRINGTDVWRNQELCEWDEFPPGLTPSASSGRPDHPCTVNTLVFSPDGSVLVSGGNDHKTIIWDTTDWEISQTLEHGDVVKSIAFSRNGSLLAIATNCVNISLCGADSDADGIADTMDQCPGTSDADGCELLIELLDPLSEIHVPKNVRLALGAAIAVVLLLVTVKAVKSRFNDDDDWDDVDPYADDVTPSTPTRPPPIPEHQTGLDTDLQGVWGDDGYEWIEHPQGSDEWYWRDPDTSQWVRH